MIRRCFFYCLKKGVFLLKTIIALFLLSFLCRGNPYYLMDATAYANVCGTFFQSEDGNVWAIDGDHYYGSVVLIMDNNGTVDKVTDDIIFAVIER